jgi:PAS domain S-box-containing protein
MLGYTREEFARLSIPTYRVGMSEAAVRQHCQKILQGGIEVFETLHLTKTGETLNIEVRASRISLNNQMLIQAVWRDITDRKRTETALQLSEDKFRSIVENTRDWIWACDCEARLIYSNPAIEEILGYSPAELAGRSAMEFMTPRSQAELQERFPGILRSRKGWTNWELSWRHKNGSVRWLESSATPVLDTRGVLVGFRGVDRDITEQKRLSNELRTQEERLQQGVSVANLGLFEHDHRTNEILFSPEMRAIWAWGDDEPITLPKITERVHSDDRAAFTSALKRSYDPRGDGDFSVEHRLLHPDGTVRWISTRARTTFEGKKRGRRAALTIGAVLDITGRKEHEHALALALQEINTLKIALDEHAIVAITDVQGRITYTNEKFCTVSGYARGELLGQDHRIINAGYHPKTFFRGLWTTIKNGKIWHGEVCNRAKDGSIFWLNTTIVPFRNLDGELCQFVTVRTDITKRKQVEAALRESESRIQQALHASHSYTFEWRPATDMVVRSISCGHILGLTGDRIRHDTGRGFIQHLPPDDRLRLQQQLQQLTPARNSYEIQFRYRRDDGRVVILEECSRATFDAAGRLEVLVGVITDITEHKQAEEQIQELNRTLEQRVSERTAALARLHEQLQVEAREREALQQELVAAAEQERLHLGQDLHDGLCQSLAGARFKLETLARDLTGLAPAEAVRTQAVSGLVTRALEEARSLVRGLQPVPDVPEGLSVALHELARSTEALFAVRCRLRGVQALPAFDHTTATSLFRIAQEAVHNAIKHGKADQIQIGLSQRAGRVTLTVANNGRPIEFDAKDAGMGLKFMRYRAERIGARLDVNAGRNGGVTVRCVLPLSQSSTSGQARARAQQTRFRTRSRA